MAEMIVVKCDIGSKAATVLCPNCARISRQILRMAYNNSSNNEFRMAHTCPVCGMTYRACNSFGSDAWRSAFAQYDMNSDAYNSSVRDNYNHRMQMAQTPHNEFSNVNRSNSTTTSRNESNNTNTSSANNERQRVYSPETKPVNISTGESASNNMHANQSSQDARNISQTFSESNSAPVTETVQEQASRPVSETIQEQISRPVPETIQEQISKPVQNQEEVTDSFRQDESIKTVQNNTRANDSSSFQSVDMDNALLDRKIERWKKELLDTSKRNRMINYRESKRQTLKILEPGAEELFNHLAFSEKALTFQRPISKDSDFRTYAMLALLETLSYSLPVHIGDIKAEGTVMEREKTLKNLRAKTRLAQEEQGTNILYLSFGFIIWRENNRSNSPWLKAPLLMMPVQLGLKSLNAPYTISKHDDEIEVNPTLDYLFNHDYGIDLPAFELKKKDSFENYMEQIEEIVDKKGWKLVREVSLGLLSFLKISMYHDLNNNRIQMMNNSVIQAISGNRHALGDLPVQAYNFNFDKTQPTEWHEVVDSDSSQEEAILLSKLGVSFVMQGPPGTGKSQTITNIIAEALGDGKKVLFVSEKSAALQVVLKRLTEANLDDFCLSLHNYKANKKEIIDNIGANLGLDEGYLDNSIMGELTELFHDRLYLDEYAEDLHKIIEPFGESVYTVYGRLASLSEATPIDYKIDNPTKISKEEYNSLLFLVDAFEKALNSIDDELTANPWEGTTASSSGQVFKNELVSATEGLDEQLVVLEKSINAFNSEYDTSVGLTWQECTKGIQSIESVFELPLFPYEWIDKDRRKYLKEKALREEQIDNDERNHAITLSGLIDDVKKYWDTDKMLLSVKRMASLFDGRILLNGVDYPDSIAECSCLNIEILNEIRRTAEDLLENYNRAKELLKIDNKDNIASIKMVSRVLNLLVNAPIMDATWFDVRKNPEYYSTVSEAKQQSSIVENKTNQLLQTWEPGVFNIDVDSMLARFKIEYTGMFYKLKGSYKEDVRQIKLLSRQVGIQIGDAEVISLLQQISDINNEKNWFNDNADRLEKACSNYYQGANTDWDKVIIGIQTAREIANQFPYANIPSEVISAIVETENSMQNAAEVRRLADILSENDVHEFVKKICNVGILTSIDEECSLSENILKRVEEIIESEKNCQTIIKEIDNIRIDNVTSYNDLDLLISNVVKIQEEGQWFRTSIPDIATELNLSEIDENEAIKELIQRANLIIQNHDAIAEKDETEELTGYFGSRYTGNNTDWQAIIRDLDKLDEFDKLGVTSQIEGFLKMASEDSLKREVAKDRVKEIETIVEDNSPKIEFFDSLFSSSDLKVMDFNELSNKYKSCLNGFGELNKWLDYVETKKECDEKGLGDFTDKITERNNSVKDVKNAFERGFYMQWLSLAIDDVAAVQTFRRRVHEQRLGKFVKLDEKQFEFSKERIRNKIISSFPDTNAVMKAKSELGILRHEMEKKKRIKPLRRLFHEIPNLLLTLKPCLMMSPLSVAYFLNAEDYHFDMVIFDEASQIFPQDAIGAIFRADQAIIAGDTKQLPPTNFFSASTSNSNDEFDDDNDEEFEDEIYDSILEETANVLPNRTLLWHYRSKHEHLIAFSNQEIYKNELVTFPSSNESEPDTGVELSFVEGGYYERGTKRNNILEAKRCVELVVEHINNNPDRSLGIIAFSEAQQQTISNEIQKFREENPRYEEFFNEDKEEPFFVKNLENVQGDERDTIILSICYARTKEQIANNKPMAMNFGPVMKAGGERRLNVAITRAKINVKLVSSIKPSDIDLSRTTSDGIRMIRSYIEFASNGGASLIASDNNRAPDYFANAIYQYITDRGYKAKQNVGCSGYRIDIAVEHPEVKEEFVAGIECDGLAYAHAKTARDRDRLRGTVLNSMGWNLYRVWSTEWYRNPEIEGEKLIEFIEDAIKQTDKRLQNLQERKKELKRQKEDEQERKRIEREEKKRAQEEQRIADAQKARKEKEAEKRRQSSRKKPEKNPQEYGLLREQRTGNERRENEKISYVKEPNKDKNQESWMQVGITVKHDSFGFGTVRELTEKYVAVEFPSGEKKFTMPNAIEKGYLKEANLDYLKKPLKKKSTTTQIDHQVTLDELMHDNQTHGDLFEELVNAGFNCVDNRGSSSIIWVLYQEDMKDRFEEIVKRNYVQFKLERRGAKATDGKAAWRIMT